MENLIARFGSIIATITGNSETILTATVDQHNVTEVNAHYFSAIADNGELAFHSIRDSNFLLIVDSKGINYHIEKLPEPTLDYQEEFILESIEFIDRHSQLINLKFGSIPSNGMYNVLSWITIVKIDNTSYNCTAAKSDTHGYSLPFMVSSMVVFTKIPFALKLEGILIGQHFVIIHVQDIEYSKLEIGITLGTKSHRRYSSLALTKLPDKSLEYLLRVSGLFTLRGIVSQFLYLGILPAELEYMSAKRMSVMLYKYLDHILLPRI